jgi:tRNA(His) 5'-end guanylyltransferase
MRATADLLGSVITSVTYAVPKVSRHTTVLMDAASTRFCNRSQKLASSSSSILGSRNPRGTCEGGTMAKVRPVLRFQLSPKVIPFL